MKKILVLTVIAVMSTVHSIHGQEMNDDVDETNHKIGFGVSLIDIKEVFQIISSSSDIAPTFYLPIELSGNLRLEPEIGYYLTSFEEKKTEGGWSEKTQEKSQFLHIGLGITPLKHMGGFLMYYGLRVGYLRYSSKWTYQMGASTTDESQSNGFYLSPQIGGEYRFSQHFSVGGEIQLRFITIDGEEKEHMRPNTNIDLFTSSLSTRALLISRFYF